MKTSLPRPRRYRGTLATLLATGAVTGAALVTVPALPAHAATGGPDGGNYYVTDSTEPGGPAAGPFSSVAGSSSAFDIGSHCDDCVTPLTLPFPVDLYDHVGVTQVNVSSNGNIQFDTANTGWWPEVPPTNVYGTVLMPFQTDLRTDLPGTRIIASTTGLAPHRQFVVEWAAATWQGKKEYFQVVLTEGSRTVEYRYLDVTPGELSHVVAIQGDGGSDGAYLNYTQGGRDVSNGLAVRFRASTTDVQLIGIPQQPVYGQRSVFTAHVSRRDGVAGVPTGTVTFSDGHTALATVPLNRRGDAVWRPQPLDVGDHRIVASYSGDAEAARSPYVGYLVSPGASTLTISAPGSTAYGTRVAATVQVTEPATGVATGQVRWYDGDEELTTTPLTKGATSLPPSALEPGGHHLTAVFESGDGRHEQSADTADVAVVRAGTTTGLAVSPHPVVHGRKAVLIAQVTPGTRGVPLSGQVVFRDGGAVIGSVTLSPTRTARLTWTATAAGHHDLSAEYVGDSRYAGSSSTPVDTVVQ